MHRIHRYLALLVTALLLGGCSSGHASSGEGARKKALHVGFMGFDIGVDPFVSVMVDAVKKEAAAKGIDLDIRNGGNDINKQISAVQDFITARKDAIIVYPGDPEGIVPAVRRAAAAHIPVFVLNLKLKPGTPVISYTGADDRDYGRQQGALLVKAIGSSGNVAVMMGQLGTSAQLERTQGLEDYLKAYPNIKIVDRKPDDWAADKSLALAQDWATKYPEGRLAAVVVQGPEAVGAAKWMRRNGRAEVKFILGDYPVDVRNAIASGLVTSTVNQDPRPQGTRVVDAVYNWLTGAKDKVVRPADHLPLAQITKDNVASIPAAYGG